MTWHATVVVTVMIPLCLADSGDRDFEPSAELLIHDYDDEGTMEEEENLTSDSGDNEEIDDLQKVMDIHYTIDNRGDTESKY